MAALVARHPDGAIRRVVLCGSPRPNGHCAQMARKLADGFTREYPGDQAMPLFVSGLDIHGCIGCDHCREAGECVFADDMASVLAALDDADELHVVCPVYFAGPPSQMKALLDRLQPHFWKGTRGQPKRPLHLHVVGEGGDPHGYDPLVTICKSAFAVAGFALQEVSPHVGLAEGEGVDDE